ncbi:hypothetical protein SAMN04489812_0571 [Microlunatus soli]|uniref:Uncharacterized protein n=2 Tax=Microlunatus soli TaxID=630515 RepID=A0A1H1NME7_9ACTN|nr:hypothetical protein SAMN04489812_0571 [Microlunatus soli]
MASVLRSRPDLPPAHRGFAFAAVIGYTAVFHGVAVVLVAWFTAKTWSGRRWARIALSSYLVTASVLGLLSATADTPFLIVVVVTDAIHLIMLGLLWLPPSVRSYFQSGRASFGPE